MTGAFVETYLLEKSRVTHQKAGEGNFHIFYKLCAYKGVEIRNDYINTSFGGHSPTSVFKRKRLCAEYLDVISAMKSIGVPDINELEDRILGIMRLGFVKFADSGDGVVRVRRNTHFSEFCRVYGFEEGSFEGFLVKHPIKVRGEVIEICNTVEQAQAIRNSVARSLYSDIFEHIVRCMNRCLGGGDGPSISVIDIFGFEVLESNGLDQLCINWTNERIQDEFVRRIFVEKQDVYKREGISWEDIEYRRSMCISDLEGKCGLMELIDEESSNAWGSSKNLGMKIRSHAKGGIKMKADDRVVVSHYAGDVEYDLDDFLDKNRERCGKVLNGTFFVGRDGGSLVKYFRRSMDSLFDSVNRSQIKYVRCIKPNAEKLCMAFDRKMVLKQLVECGILETVKVAKQCFLHDVGIEEFMRRYGILRNNGIVERLGILRGATRMFMNRRDFEVLEICRHLSYAECCRVIKVVFWHHLKACAAGKKRAIEFSSRNGKGSEVDSSNGGSLDTPQADSVSCEVDTDNTEKLQTRPFSGEVVGVVNTRSMENKVAENCGSLNLSEATMKLLPGVEEYKECHEVSCSNCKSLELKCKFQVEALKKKNIVELELERYKAKAEYLEKLLQGQDEEDEDLQMDMLFMNIHNVFNCLVQLYLECVPVFSDEEIPRLEILSFAHSILHIVNKTEKGIAESTAHVVDEIGRNLKVFERDIHKVLFMLSNLIEYKGILHGQDMYETEDVENLISSLFRHLCELQRSSLLEILPHSVLEHQQLQRFMCHEGYLRKIFKPPSISRLVRLLEYFYGQMLYYYIPEAYVMESVNYMLKTINTSVFNELLVKRSFLSFNRRVQINYNINEIGKFCRSIVYLEGMHNLAHAVSAIKLANLVEANAATDVILNECSVLNSIQMNEIASKIDGATPHSFGRDNQCNKFLPEPTLFLPLHKETVSHSFLCPRYLPSGSLQSIFKSVWKQPR